MERQLNKPKTQKGRRFVESRLPKVHEEAKKTLFLRGVSANLLVSELLKELFALSQPNAVLFRKNNATRPFEDTSKLEFFCKKEDAALFVLGSSTKKRPNSLIIGRIFDEHVIEMYELAVSRFASLQAYSPRERVPAGTRPSLVFLGDAFEFDVELKALRNVLVDTFGGSSLEKVQLDSFVHVVVFAVREQLDQKTEALRRVIQCRTYRIYQKRGSSGASVPRAELEEMGPSFEFQLRRVRLPNPEMWKRAIQQPKESKPKTTKNVEMDVFGSKLGRIHVPKQDLANLHVRKVRALRGDKTSIKRKRVDAGNASRRTAAETDPTAGEVASTPMDAE